MPYVLIGLAALGLALLVYAHMIEPGFLVARQKTLPAAWLARGCETRRVLFLSDIHAGPNYGQKRLDRLAEAVRREAPDLIVFGGDLVAERSRIADAAFRQMLVNFFRTIGQTAPVVAVYGNHDVEAPANRALIDYVYEAAAVRLLVNESDDVAGVPVYGCDDGFHGDPAAPPASFAGLVVAHQPDLADRFRSRGQGVILSGHAHRGQVTWFGRPIVTVPLGRIYRYGEYVTKSGRLLIVSGGIGTVHLPLRFGARPEYWLLTLENRGGESADSRRA